MPLKINQEKFTNIGRSKPEAYVNRGNVPTSSLMARQPTNTASTSVKTVITSTTNIAKPNHVKPLPPLPLEVIPTSTLQKTGLSAFHEKAKSTAIIGNATTTNKQPSSAPSNVTGRTKSFISFALSQPKATKYSEKPTTSNLVTADKDNAGSRVYDRSPPKGILGVVRSQQQHNDKSKAAAITFASTVHQKYIMRKPDASNESDFVSKSKKMSAADLTRGVRAVTVKPRSELSFSASAAAAIKIKALNEHVGVETPIRANPGQKNERSFSQPERSNNEASKLASNLDSLVRIMSQAQNSGVNEPRLPETVPKGDANERNVVVGKKEMEVLMKSPLSSRNPVIGFNAKIAQLHTIVGAEEVPKPTDPKKQSSIYSVSNPLASKSPSKSSGKEAASDASDDEPLSSLKSSKRSKRKSVEESSSSTIKCQEVTRSTSNSTDEVSKSAATSCKPVTRKVPCPLCGQLFTTAGVVKHAATCSLPSSKSRNRGNNKRYRNSSSSSKDDSNKKRAKINKQHSNETYSGDDVAKDDKSRSQNFDGNKVTRTVTQADLDRADAAIQNSFQLQKSGTEIKWVREKFPAEEKHNIIPPTVKPYASAADAKNFYSNVLTQCGATKALQVLKVIKMSRDGHGNALALISRMKSALADKEGLVKEFCYNFLPEIDIDRIYSSIPGEATNELNMDGFALSRTSLSATWKKGNIGSHRTGKVVLVRASPPSGRNEIDLTDD